MIEKKSLPEKLRIGNEKFQQCELYSKDRMALISNQDPQVIVIGCSDSRVPLEIVFQSELGELFPIRNAGNIVDSVTLGSVEYAIRTFKAAITLMVVGHQKCGAVTAAYDSLCDKKVTQPHIDALIVPIQTAMKSANINAHLADRDMAIEQAVKANVRYQAQQLLERSPIIAQAVKEEKMKLIVAVYDLGTGAVEVLD